VLALTDPKSPRVESVPNGVSSALFGNQDTIPLMQTRLDYSRRVSCWLQSWCALPEGCAIVTRNSAFSAALPAST